MKPLEETLTAKLVEMIQEGSASVHTLGVARSMQLDDIGPDDIVAICTFDPAKLNTGGNATS